MMLYNSENPLIIPFPDNPPSPVKVLIENNTRIKIVLYHPIGKQIDGYYISEDVLLKMYRDKIGTKIENSDFLIVNVYSDGINIHIECIERRE